MTDTGLNSAASSHAHVGRFTFVVPSGARVTSVDGHADLGVRQLRQDLGRDRLRDVRRRRVTRVHPEDGLARSRAHPDHPRGPRSTIRGPPIALAGLVLVEILVRITVDVALTLRGIPLVAGRPHPPDRLQIRLQLGRRVLRARTNRQAGSTCWWWTSPGPPTHPNRSSSGRRRRHRPRSEMVSPSTSPFRTRPVGGSLSRRQPACRQRAGNAAEQEDGQEGSSRPGQGASPSAQGWHLAPRSEIRIF